MQRSSFKINHKTVKIFQSRKIFSRLPEYTPGSDNSPANRPINSARKRSVIPVLRGVGSWDRLPACHVKEPVGCVKRSGTRWSWDRLPACQSRAGRVCAAKAEHTTHGGPTRKFSDSRSQYRIHAHRAARCPTNCGAGAKRRAWCVPLRFTHPTFSDMSATVAPITRCPYRKAKLCGQNVYPVVASPSP